MKRKIIACILILICNFLLFSENFEKIEPTSSVLSFAQNEIGIMMGYLNNSFESIPFSFALDFNIFAKNFTNCVGHSNSMIGTFIKIHDNIMVGLNIPFIMSVSIEPNLDWTNRNDNLHNSTYIYDLFMTSSLIINNKYGTFGGIIGYNKSLDRYHDNNGFKFGLIPIINAREYPYLKYIFDQLNGLISYDLIENKKNVNYSFNLLSVGFSMGLFNVNSISYFQKDIELNIDTRSKIYGMGLSFGLTEKLHFNTDIGYQYFYETKNHLEWYNNTMFVKAGIFHIGLMDISVYLIFDKLYSPFPKIGYSQSIKNGLTYCFLEFGYSSKERIYAAIGWRLVFKNLTLI